MALIYFIIGTSWILLSDQVLGAIFSADSQLMIGSVKGVAFVLVTSVVLFFLINRYVKRIRLNEAQYSALFRTHPQPLWIYDTKTLKFLAVNNAAIKKYGYSRDEFLHLTMLDIRPESEREAIKAFLTAARAEYIADIVHLHQDKDGRQFYTRTSSHATMFDGKPARMVMAVDAEAEKDAERRLNVSEIKLNSLLNNTDDIIWLYDETGAIITHNHAFKKKFEAVLNVKVPDELPFRIDAMAGNPIIDRWLVNLQRAMRGAHLRVEEGFFNHATGHEDYFEIIMTPIYDTGNNLIGVGAIAREITERIISQKEIEERVKQLKEIAWIQSHEVRRPLANIMGLAELLKLHPNMQQTDEAIEMLEKSCNELDEIIRDVVKKSGSVK